MIPTHAANTLLRRLAIALPIIQSPMAGVSSPRMAAAVSNAGGLGSIALGAVDAEGAAHMIAEVRERTGKPFNVNVLCHRAPVRNLAVEAAWLERLRPAFERLGALPPDGLTTSSESFVSNEAMLALLVNARAPVVSFHLGLPSRDALDALHAVGSVLMATATSLAEARCVVQSGVDIVVAQGFEAGGHRGVFDPEAVDDGLSTSALTRLLTRHLDVPIVSAGGIMDGVGIAAALHNGASAAQLGTAFIATDESLATAAHRAAPNSLHTVMTRAITGRPARAVANSLTAQGEGVHARDIPDFPIAYAAARALDAAAGSVGDVGFGAWWAGRGASEARAIPVADLMAWLQLGMALC